MKKHLKDRNVFLKGIKVYVDKWEDDDIDSNCYHMIGK